MAGSDWDVPMSLEELKEFDELVDDDIPIYPYPEGSEKPQFYYTYDHLLDLSKKSIQKFNQDTGTQFQFVELEEAFRYRSFTYDTIRAYFIACQPDGIILTFQANIDCPHNDATNLQRVSVFPLPDSASHTSDSPAQNLEAQVELLKV
ncbi:hypothetical protein OROHE_021041 [Orobanche hederae]